MKESSKLAIAVISEYVPMVFLWGRLSEIDKGLLRDIVVGEYGLLEPVSSTSSDTKPIYDLDASAALHAIADGHVVESEEGDRLKFDGTVLFNLKEDVDWERGCFSVFQSFIKYRIVPQTELQDK